MTDSEAELVHREIMAAAFPSQRNAWEEPISQAELAMGAGISCRSPLRKGREMYTDDTIISGGKIFRRCGGCRQWVQMNKFLIGSLHVCS